MINLTEEEWLENWKREGKKDGLTLDEYKAECQRQSEFVEGNINEFFGGGK